MATLNPKNCGLFLALAALTPLAAHAQAFDVANGATGTTNIIINLNTQNTVGSGNTWVGRPAPSVDTSAVRGSTRRGYSPSFWNHNDSVVYLEAAGNQRRFYYHRPRPGMVEAGAGPGSLVFEGVRLNNNYVGKAYLFAGRCGRYEYPASGYVQEDRRVVMNGMAPRVDRQDCSIVGYRPDVLAFDLL